MSAAVVDLRIAGGTVVLPDGPRPADLLIDAGRIVGIVEPGALGEARELIDAAGRHIMPGAVDAHVHLGADIMVPRTPADARLETAAAAAGGVTTVIAYLMSAEPYDDVYPIALAAMEADALVDFGFHFCIGTREQLDAIPHYVTDLGVSSFKFFVNFRTDEGLRLGLPGNDDSFLLELLEAAAANGAVVNPHAENADLIKHLAASGVFETAGNDLELWDRSRPDFVEAEALSRVSLIAEHAGAGVHAVHVTNALSLEVLRGVRARHPQISIETCPHYLTLDVTDELGVIGKVNPPLRHPSDREALWSAVADGTVDTIGSDHVPRHVSGKEGGLRKASPGFPGLQGLLPLMLSEGHQRRGIPLERIADLVAARPAETFGLGATKGTIREGADADLVIVDLNTPSTISTATELSGAGFTPWDGTTVGVTIDRTLLRGRTVFAGGELVDSGRGQYLPRHASAVTHTPHAGDRA